MRQVGRTADPEHPPDDQSIVPELLGEGHIASAVELNAGEPGEFPRAKDRLPVGGAPDRQDGGPFGGRNYFPRFDIGDPAGAPRIHHSKVRSSRLNGYRHIGRTPQSAHFHLNVRHGAPRRGHG
jgi:hypothetical protein